MTFEYVQLDAEEMHQLVSRVIGPALSISRGVVVDRGSDTFLITLGCEPHDAASDDEEITYYNMMHGAEVFSANGYDIPEKAASGWVVHYVLNVSLPRTWENRVEEVRFLMEGGLKAYQSAVRKRQQAVQLSFDHVAFR